ncbi:MAG: NBR1-Ig-like domain-containing protein, partial [Chloroflexota bacterium]
PTPTPCLPDAAFVQDVAVPDGAEFLPGESFTKVWRMRSSGCAPWESGTRFVFVSGDRMAAPDGVAVPDTSVGDTADIAVEMRAPDSPGTYQGNWRMESPDGALFGDRVYVKIAVAQPTPTRDSRPTVSILIKNETGGTLSLTLRGPASYDFTFAPGDHTIQIVPGTYNYTGRGCGGATESGTKTISDSTTDWRWWCG